MSHSLLPIVLLSLYIMLIHFWKYGPFKSCVPGERVGEAGRGGRGVAVGCLPFVRMVGTPCFPSYGWSAPYLALLGGWWAVAVHPTSLRVPTCSSVVIRNRKDMGVGSPSLVGVRLVMVCIANYIRSSLISR